MPHIPPVTVPVIPMLDLSTLRKQIDALDALDTAPVVKATEADLEPGVATCTILKASDEDRVSWGVAYPVLRPDVAVAADGHRDFADVRTVEKAAWDFCASGREIGLHHADGTTGHGTVVESYLHRGEPLVVKAVDGSEQTVNPGDWCLSVRWDEQTWPVAKQLGGYSPQGTGRRQPASADRIASLRS